MSKMRLSKLVGIVSIVCTIAAVLFMSPITRANHQWQCVYDVTLSGTISSDGFARSFNVINKRFILVTFSPITTPNTKNGPNPVDILLYSQLGLNESTGAMTLATNSGLVFPEDSYTPIDLAFVSKDNQSGRIDVELDPNEPSPFQDVNAFAYYESNFNSGIFRVSTGLMAIQPRADGTVMGAFVVYGYGQNAFFPARYEGNFVGAARPGGSCDPRPLPEHMVFLLFVRR